MEYYFTQENKEISDRVEDGRTILFECPVAAEAYARQKKSYHYLVIVKNFLGKKINELYGVPK